MVPLDAVCMFVSEEPTLTKEGIKHADCLPLGQEGRQRATKHEELTYPLIRPPLPGYPT